MDLKFRQVEIFWAVMTAGTVTEAASILNTSQPTVSREISLFEHATQLNLFERKKGKLVPTEHAIQLFEEVKSNFMGLDRIRNAVEKIRNFHDTQLQITCLPAFSIALLPHVCNHFRQDFPEVFISISAQESPNLERSLSSQCFHLGLIESNSLIPGTSVNPLINLEMVCVMPFDHPLKDRKIITPEDFEGRDFVHLASNDPYRALIDNLFSSYGIVRNSAVETDNASAVCATVAIGGGLSIVNPLTALHYESSGLVIRRLSKTISYNIYTVTPIHRPFAPQFQPFLHSLNVYCESLPERLELYINK